MSGMIANFINSLFRVMELAIIIECLLSWIVRDRNSGIMGVITSFTDPILKPFRILQEKLLGDIPIDMSPIFAFITLDLLKPIVMSLVVGIL
ncbi:YggT family protein [Clostridium moniliforme]|uniref:YggT family protein n=1 Tax=Clostridium moniliforme TaxID=39489 RepID=A0ABS4F0H4_9CLOT|nr:YggT family protein [Clostridium moniliforme]MBP1889730.1 YggT family protein [Clostridium moniliforme]